MPRQRKWKRLKAERPEGEKWVEAERWEITVPPSWSDMDGGLGSGRRYVWVVQGTKWVYIRDNEKHRRVSVIEWAPVARKGRAVS